jgi:NTE family protein
MGKTILALGGGAPNFTLMSGALLALDEANVKIDMVSMTGGGSVVGMLYLAPKGMNRRQALQNTINYGVSDLIYDLFPVNYKLFQKPGPAADCYRTWLASLPGVRRWFNQLGMSNAQALFSDWLQLTAAMMCPIDLNYFSTGLCAHAPFIQEVVDFDALKNSAVDCHLHAFCIEDRELVTFLKHQVDVHRFRAGLSFPFIYPPYRIDGKHYFEGAAYQALALKGLVQAQDDVDKIILMDVLRDGLIIRPRNIWEAYSQSIIMPLIALAGRELAIFEYWVRTGEEIEIHPWETQRTESPGAAGETPAVSSGKRPKVELYQIRLQVPEEHKRHTLTWARSNLEYLFGLGYSRGQEFMQRPENQVLLG